MTRPQPLETRLWSKVKKSADGCWLWCGGIHRDGYGKINVQGKMKWAHRVVYELTHGTLDSSMDVHHICENRRCVRPEHLQAVPHGEHTLLSRANWAHQNRKKTHCPKGHPYDEQNTYVWPNARWNSRACRTCLRERSARRYRERNAA